MKKAILLSTQPKHLKEWRNIFAHHHKHGGDVSDWVSFIPEEFWPFFRRRLTDMKLPGSDDNRFTEAQAADWQSSDVLTVMDCILARVGKAGG